MLDTVLHEFDQLVSDWNAEVSRDRQISNVNPIADTTAFRARQLSERIRQVKERTEQLSPAQFAALHNTTPQTVTTWCRERKIECEPNGKSYLIPRGASAPRSRATKGRKRAARG